MKTLTILLLAISSFANTKVSMDLKMGKKDLGQIVIELYDKKAPITTKNFVQYVNSGFYNGTIFHRVIDNFMIQGGGFDTNLKRKKTRAPIKNEADNKVGNEEFTIAMARTSDINSATAQFFINVKNNTFLNYQGPSNYGYAVFGKVVKGTTIVNQIKKTQTTRNGMFQNLPVTNVVISKAQVLKK